MPKGNEMCWMRCRGKKRTVARLAFLLFFLCEAGAIATVRASGQTTPRRTVREVFFQDAESEEAVLGKPLALAPDDGRLYIADALDCVVKIFSTDGRYLGAIGRKGQGPGELSFPSGVCVSGGTIAVADKMNFRVRLFDREGHATGGFKLPFAPDRILALDGGRLLITSNPTAKRAGEKILHIFDRQGGIVWEGLEPKTSSDPVKDAFRNMIVACAGTGGDFYVVFRSGERTIRHFSASGGLAGTIDVDPAYSFKNVETPDAGHGRLKLAGFCWAAAFDAGLLYLSPPEVLDGKDLGPGRTIRTVDPETGRLRGEAIDLPCAVHRFIVAGERIFAIDDEGSLRIFEVDR